jgi:hypothetical protein
MMQAQVTLVAGRARQYGHAGPTVAAGKALQGILDGGAALVD